MRRWASDSVQIGVFGFLERLGVNLREVSNFRTLQCDLILHDESSKTRDKTLLSVERCKGLQPDKFVGSCWFHKVLSTFIRRAF